MIPILSSDTIITRIENLQREKHVSRKKRAETKENLGWAWNILYTMYPEKKNVTDIAEFKRMLYTRKIPYMVLSSVIGSVPQVCR